MMKEDKFFKERKRILPLIYVLFAISVLGSITAPWIGLCLSSVICSISSVNEDMAVQKTGKALFCAGASAAALCFVLHFILKLY